MSRPIDHLVLAARDLEAAAQTYHRLGFTVGGRNRHPWGTENHIVQLDGSFLEILGLGPGFEMPALSEAAAPFARTLAQFLDRREGLAQVALQSRDAGADADVFAQAGLPSTPLLHFGRTSVGEDGRHREVAFTLAFAAERPEAAPQFFVCQHHRPENFWARPLQQHRNGARRLIGVVMAADPTSRPLEMLRTLFGPAALTLTREGAVVTTGTETIEIMHPDRLRASYGDGLAETGFVAYRIGVTSIEAARRILDESGLPFGHEDGRVIVGPRVAHGVALSFEALPA